MRDDSLQLYVDSNLISPYSLSAFVALTEKDLLHGLHKINLAAGAHLQDDYAQQSITRRVPTLQHGEFSLSESSAIAEYLEDAFPAPQHAALYPSTTQNRARARQIQAWLRSDLGALREDRSTEVVFITPSLQPLSAAGQAAANKLIAAITPLLADDRDNLFDAWCIADTDLAVMLMRLIKNGDPVPERLVRYAEHQWDRPAIQQWLQLRSTF